MVDRGVELRRIEAFAEWLTAELQARGWGQADLARASGLDTGVVARILTQQRAASPDACLNIARGLRLPPEQVFRARGWLPAAPGAASMVHEISETAAQLSPEEQIILLRIARSFAFTPQAVKRGRPTSTRS
jgi:transcriptional regulator with XRE-family HTH domain